MKRSLLKSYCNIASLIGFEVLQYSCESKQANTTNSNAPITRCDFFGRYRTRYRAIFIANRMEPITRDDFLYFRPTSCASCDRALWRDLWCKVK